MAAWRGRWLAHIPVAGPVSQLSKALPQRHGTKQDVLGEVLGKAGDLVWPCATEAGGNYRDVTTVAVVLRWDVMPVGLLWPTTHNPAPEPASVATKHGGRPGLHHP